MVILENPYVSDELCAYLEKSRTPVLHNAVAESLRARHALNLLDDTDFLRGLSGQRLYTTSENALEWVYAHVPDQDLLRAVRLMKDKHALRQAIRPLYPDYAFSEVSMRDLRTLDPDSLPLPLILKPSVGFFSMGVYAVSTQEDWFSALADIEQHMDGWRAAYPEGVLSDARFLLESFIQGDEYAVDCYFDAQGRAVILNIMHHFFSSDADVSDRLYCTGREIIESTRQPFTEFLNAVNGCLGVRNFPAHVELRVDKDRIIPIEFNPLRFSGWCTTDLALFAFGLNTCACYLTNSRPDWDVLLAGKENRLYSVIVLDKPEHVAGKSFDYAGLCDNFAKVLTLRRLEEPDCPVFGFLFTETPADQRQELDRIMRSDLTEFLH